jgi:hypothetical protein
MTFGMDWSSARRAMTDLVNVLLWFGMFAIPMMIVVVMQRVGRRQGWDDRAPSADPSREPDYRRWR